MVAAVSVGPDRPSSCRIFDQLLVAVIARSEPMESGPRSRRCGAVAVDIRSDQSAAREQRVAARRFVERYREVIIILTAPEHVRFGADPARPCMPASVFQLLVARQLETTRTVL
jgi:hypothetical protein